MSDAQPVDDAMAAGAQIIFDALAPWKRKKFRPTDILFEDAANSLGSESPTVVVKQLQGSTKFTVTDAVNNKAAVLIHTGIWKRNSPLETGNLVPAGRVRPANLSGTQMTTSPSWLCEVQHIFDTSVDGTLWDYLKLFEDHVCKDDNFKNYKSEKPRRSYQSGNTPMSRLQYIVASKLFVRRTALNCSQDGKYKVPYEVHPWILEALQGQSEPDQIPNPRKPLYLDLNPSTGALSTLKDLGVDEYQAKDIVLMAFTLSFSSSATSWFPELTPLEFVRLGSVVDAVIPRHPNLYTEPENTHVPLKVGSTVTLLEDEPPNTSPANDTATGKRKERSPDLSDERPDKRHQKGTDTETSGFEEEKAPERNNRSKTRAKGKELRSTARG